MTERKPLKEFEVTLPNRAIYKSGIKSLGPHSVMAYSEEQALAKVLANEGNVLGARYKWLFEKLKPDIGKYVKETIPEPSIYDIEISEQEPGQLELFPAKKKQGGCGCMFPGGD